MATKTVREKVCDLCGEGPIVRYKISPLEDGYTRTVELCERHAEPVRLILARIDPRPSARERREVVTLAQIEEMKKGGGGVAPPFCVRRYNRPFCASQAMF